MLKKPGDMQRDKNKQPEYWWRQRGESTGREKEEVTLRALSRRFPEDKKC